MKSKYLFILLIILIIVLGSWFIIHNYKLPKELDKGISSETNNNQTLKNEDGVIIPDLDRSIVVTANLSAESKNKLTDVIKKVSYQLRGNPDDLDGWLILGLYRREIGDAEGARQAFEYLTIIRPQDYRAFNNLGVLYSHELKDFEKAEYWYKKGIEADLNSISSYSALAEFYQYFVKETDKAVETYLLGLKNNPGNLSLISQLAYSYKEIGEKEKAIEYFENLLILDNSNIRAKQELEQLRNN